MIIYLSGEENLARPEVMLGKDATIMMTFYMIRPKKNGRPDKRFRKIYAMRKKQREGRKS